MQCAWVQAPLDSFERIRSVQDQDLAELWYRGETEPKREEWTERSHEYGLGREKSEENRVCQAAEAACWYLIWSV